MKTKEQILDFVKTDLVMKSKTISHIILEGTDGVGKTTMLTNLLKYYNYRYIVYDRGELSNMFYARKYNRQFYSLQRNLPFLHVVLTCDKEELRKRIIARHQFRGTNDLELIEDLNKIDDQDKIIELANNMKNDFHVIIVDITGLNEAEATLHTAERIDKYIDNLQTDVEETEWNKAYRLACEKLGYDYKVRANQPYLNERMMMSESTWQNGTYETFTDKRCPDNLLFSLSYDVNKWTCHNDIQKDLDFAYIINSKINRRHEIVDYYLAMQKHNKTCLVASKIYEAFDDDEHFKLMPRTFGDGFIEQLSRAKATVYCARDLEYLKLQTARLYEAILARQILFVDEQSDLNRDMLSQIFSEEYVELLTVTPETICEKYDYIISHPEIYSFILTSQLGWYRELIAHVFGKDVLK